MDPKTFNELLILGDGKDKNIQYKRAFREAHGTSWQSRLGSHGTLLHKVHLHLYVNKPSVHVQTSYM